MNWQIASPLNELKIGCSSDARIKLGAIPEIPHEAEKGAARGRKPVFWKEDLILYRLRTRSSLA